MCVCVYAIYVCNEKTNFNSYTHSHTHIVLCWVLIIDAGRFNLYVCVCVLNNAAAVVLFTVASPCSVRVCVCEDEYS